MLLYQVTARIGRLALAAALVGLGVGLLAIAPARPLQAQAPDVVIDAATADLGERLGVAPDDFEVLRVASVIWNNGCIGAAEQNEACTEAEVPGFALWLSDGAVAYRYHSDTTGAALRLAESMIPLSQVPVAPLPQGATSALALERFLDLLAGAGFDEIIQLELAALRDWIPGAFSPHYIVGDATLEIFEVATVGEVDAAIERLQQFGGAAELGEDQALWRYETLIVILLSSSERAEIRGIVSGLIGAPAVETTLAAPRPRPSAALDTSVAAVLDALRRAEIEATLTDVSVHRPFLPPDALSAVLRAGDTSIEVYALLDPDAVAQAVRDASADSAASAGWVIWTRGSTLVLIEGLGHESRALLDVISEVFGATAFIGEGLAGPTPEAIVDTPGAPGALPATGNGGIDDDEAPLWVWGVIAAVAVAVIAAGGAYRVWLRGRTP